MPNGTDLLPGGLTAGPTPQWAIDLHGSEQEVYRYYGSLNEEVRNAVWLKDAQDAENLATATGGWQAGLDTLGGRSDAILNDPNLQAAFASLGEMAGADYDAIGEAERAGITSQLAGGVNRAQSDRAAALRRAGLSGSGMALENAPLFTAIGASGLADVNAQVGIANQQAREAATQQMGQLSLQQQGMLGNLDFARAGLQADVPISGYDPLVGASLDWTADQADWQRQQYEEGVAREEEQFAAWEAAQPWAGLPDWLQGPIRLGSDFFSGLLGLEGTGFYRQLPGVLTGGSSGLAGAFGG